MFNPLNRQNWKVAFHYGVKIPPANSFDLSQFEKNEHVTKFDFVKLFHQTDFTYTELMEQ